MQNAILEPKTSIKLYFEYDNPSKIKEHVFAY